MYIIRSIEARTTADGLITLTLQSLPLYNVLSLTASTVSTHYIRCMLICRAAIAYILHCIMLITRIFPSPCPKTSRLVGCTQLRRIANSRMCGAFWHILRVFVQTSRSHRTFIRATTHFATFQCKHNQILSVVFLKPVSNF